MKTVVCSGTHRDINLPFERKQLPQAVAVLRAGARMYFIKQEPTLTVLLEDDWTPQELHAIADYLECEQARRSAGLHTPGGLENKG